MGRLLARCPPLPGLQEPERSRFPYRPPAAPSVPLPCGSWPGRPRVKRGFGSGAGEISIVAAHSGPAAGESKDFLAWSKSFPSPPSCREPQGSGVGCSQQVWDLQGARKEEAAGSGHFCWQCQNLPLCSILPINKPPARAEPLASTEMFLPFGAHGVSPTMGHNGQLGGLV